MKAFALLLLFGSAVAFSSCKNTWSQEDKDQYLQTCLEGVSNLDSLKAHAYCNCMLEKIVEKYPNVNDMMEHIQDVMADQDLQRCKENLQ